MNAPRAVKPIREMPPIGIAEGLIRTDVQFDWKIQGSTNLVNRFTLDEVKMLRGACLYEVAQGADSGLPRVRHPMNKDFQKAGTSYDAGLKKAVGKLFAPPKRKEDAHMLKTEVVTC